MPNVSWLDVASQVDDKGRTLMIAEVLNQVNELGDAVMQTANNGTSHKGAIRTGIPTPTRRRLNKGVDPTKSTQKAVVFESAAYEDRGEVDEELVAIAPNKDDFRFGQTTAHLEGMSQQFAEDLFYCDVRQTPDGMTGFSAFYDDLSAESGSQIVDAGGTGANLTSLWLINWADDAVSLFTPEGFPAGIQHENKGVEKVFDADSKPYYALVDLFKLKAGLAVQNIKQVSRIANIDTSKFAGIGTDTDASAQLFMKAIDAKTKIKNIARGKPFWYGNRDMEAALQKQALSKANLAVTLENVENGPSVLRLMGIPFRRIEALTSAEDQVV